MKKTDAFLKECVAKLSDDDLEFIVSRLDQNLIGDFSDCLDVLSKNYEIDRMLRSANSVDEFYDIVDQISEAVHRKVKN
jgi:hypothetical protein